jgi:integrase
MMAGQGRGVDRLSDRRVQAFVRRARVGARLWDGHAMYLERTEHAASWRLKFRHGAHRVERSFTLGQYPTLSLADARDARNEARKLVAKGIDPVQQRRADRAAQWKGAANTFESVADEWFEHMHEVWGKEHHAIVQRTFRRDVLPSLGPLPITAIETTAISTIIKDQARRGATEVARKTKQHLERLFDYARASGYRADNPADGLGAILHTRKAKKLPALTDITSLRAVLVDVESSNASEAVKTCNLLVAHTFVRLNNALLADWQDFDLDGATWTIAREQMKEKESQRGPFVVYLTPTIVGRLREWHVRCGEPTRGQLFPSPMKPGQSIRHETLEKLYRETLGLRDRMTPHGWRSAFSSLANDAAVRDGLDRDAIERSLDHAEENEVRAAYDRGERREERIKLAAWWEANLTGYGTTPSDEPEITSIGTRRRATKPSSAAARP